MKLSIIIISWNTVKLLRECLKSLTISSEIIVVDNGSSDRSPEMVKKEFPEVKLIENKENLGFAKGNNIGLKEAKGEYVMLLNSDTLIKVNAIQKMLTFLDDRQEISIVGPRLLNSDETPQPSCGRFPLLPVVAVMLFKEHFGGSDFVRWSPPQSQQVDWLMGSAIMARKEVFQKVGGLDESLFMYMEEVEWFYRAHLAGFKAYFLKEAEIIHLGRGSSKSGKTEPILNIYKGILHFYRKHRSRPELLAVKLMLRTKALLAFIFGYLKNDNYLKQTYGQAIKIN